MNLKKVVLFAVVGVIVFFILTQPAVAAHIVNSVLETLKEWAVAIITFVKGLFS